MRIRLPNRETMDWLPQVLGFSVVKPCQYPSTAAEIRLGEMHHDFLQYLADRRRRRCLNDFSYMLVVWICSKISRRDVSRIVVPKNQAFTTHVVISLLEALNARTDINEFPHV